MGEVSGRVGSSAAPGVKPAWAHDYANKKHLLCWDSSQYIGNLGINDVLICCIVDTGAHRTIIDSVMAAALGLKVKTEGI